MVNVKLSGYATYHLQCENFSYFKRSRTLPGFFSFILRLLLRRFLRGLWRCIRINEYDWTWRRDIIILVHRSAARTRGWVVISSLRACSFLLLVLGVKILVERLDAASCAVHLK
jgi:hypothetical protein